VELTHGSLFSGIGGFDLGFERAGIKTLWQVEIDDYCRRVLAKNFPHAKRFGDIRECGAHNLARVDILSGGFPCQPVAFCGKGGAQDDERWLWPEFQRIICELRPRFVIVENVPGLLNRGMGEVLGGLAACGYDAEWDTVSACEFQAPHTRERLLIVAYPSEKRCGWQRSFWTKETSLEIGRRGAELYRPWSVEPGIPRVAYGVPNRLDRIAGVGNSFIPQIAEYIARQIIKETQI